jgi:hypothetical protein
MNNPVTPPETKERELKEAAKAYSAAKVDLEAKRGLVSSEVLKELEEIRDRAEKRWSLAGRAIGAPILL